MSSHVHILNVLAQGVILCCQFDLASTASIAITYEVLRLDFVLFNSVRITGIPQETVISSTISMSRTIRTCLR